MRLAAIAYTLLLSCPSTVAHVASSSAFLAKSGTRCRVISGSPLSIKMEQKLPSPRRLTFPTGAMDRRKLIATGCSAFLLGLPFVANAKDNSPITDNPRTPIELQFELFEKAMDYTDANDYVNAEMMWTKIIDEFQTPNAKVYTTDSRLLSRAYSNRGNARIALGRTREAVLDYSSAIEYEPLESESWLNRALAYETMAEEALVPAAPSASRLSVVSDGLRSFAVTDGQGRKGGKEGKGREGKGVGKGDGSSDSAVYYQFWTESLADYTRAIILRPNDHRLYLNRGDVYTLTGQYGKALKDYRKAMAIAPGLVGTRCKVALAEAQNGNLDRAKWMVDGLMDRYSPRYPELNLAFAALSWSLEGTVGRSADAYVRAVDEDPRLADTTYLTVILRWPPKMSALVSSLKNMGLAGGLMERSGGRSMVKAGSGRGGDGDGDGDGGPFIMSDGEDEDSMGIGIEVGPDGSVGRLSRRKMLWDFGTEYDWRLGRENGLDPNLNGKLQGDEI